MKKSLLFFSLIIGFQVLAQQMPGIPDSINYQAVLRDASGTVLTPGTSGILNFRIYSDFNSASPDYQEDHSFTTDAVGLVQLFIGGGNQIGSNTMANVNWQAGTACYEVRLNNTLIGSKQAFASVPYALYAKSAGGGSLPQGLQNQTLYHDGSVWRPTFNLANDGTNIGIGLLPNNRVKLNVFSNNSDSTVISGSKTNALGRDAAVRGSIIGSSIFSIVNPNSTIIYGADFTSTNLGTGYAVGASGIGVSGGVAVGLSGIATAGQTSTLIGVYGSAESTTPGPNQYAAFFNKGKVLVNDRIVFPTVTNNTTTLFYTLNAGNEGVWAPLPLSSSLSVIGNGIISVSPLPPSSNYTVSALPPAFTSTNIGTITTSGYPNYQLNIPSPSFSYNPSTGIWTYLQAPASSSLNLSPALGIISGSVLLVAGSTIGIPALGYWSKPSAGVTSLGNSGDFVGIGTNIPAQKLDVNGNVVVPSANEYLYAAPKGKHLSMSSYGFAPENDEAYGAKYIAGHLYASSPASTLSPAVGTAAYFNSEINLPTGATITAVEAFVVDDDATINIPGVQLWRFDSPTGSSFGSPTIMASTPGTSNANPNVQMLTTGAISLPIDNNLFHYTIRFQGAFAGTGAPGQNIRLARVRVSYIINKAD